MKEVKIGEAETYPILKHLKTSWHPNNIKKKGRNLMIFSGIFSIKSACEDTFPLFSRAVSVNLKCMGRKRGSNIKVFVPKTSLLPCFHLPDFPV